MVKQEIIDLSYDSDDDPNIPPGPGFNRTITESQATGSQTLPLRAWFVKRYMKRNNGKCTVIANGKRYGCTLCWNVVNKNQVAIGQGWYGVAKALGLREGQRIHVMPTHELHVFTVMITRGET